ncbi:Nudix family hydrolase [Candidatus Halobeggiatoa sp. HSG11]|nr:Nudix family hydrolase [Candidatus Halobeggiatoa sp. HSG11]
MCTLHVVAGIVNNSQDEILITHRSKHVHQGDLWEFPGGKVEPGETALSALNRELQEEVAITVKQARPLIRIKHTYPDKKILLDVWQIEQWQGQPWGREGQLMEWCTVDNLAKKQFPTANIAIIKVIQLPKLYLITPEPQNNKFFYQLEKCLDNGITLVQLRANQLSELTYCHYAEKALTLCEHYKAKLLVNSSPKVAVSVGANGVHLNSKRLFMDLEIPNNLLVAASCHSIAEIKQANLIKTDFIVVSPIHSTTTHPDFSPLGWQQLFQLTESANCPVFALGGMQISDVKIAIAHGAQGIAAISSLWNI